MNETGMFYGIGVGPGEPGMIPVVAWQALQSADVIYTPRAEHVSESLARQCLGDLDIPEDRFRPVIYDMDAERLGIAERYRALAREIASQLAAGRTVAYLTIGDSLTYSTYGYLLQALDELLPGHRRRTFPGITSYAALAAAVDCPLGQGKERVLILPCPDDMESLSKDIDSHDIVVLMKISHRLPAVVDLLRQKGIAGNCVFASRVGLKDEAIFKDVDKLTESPKSLSYLSTMLIRRHAPMPLTALREKELSGTKGF